MLDLAILGLLHEHELHGYEIRKRLRDDLGLFANISFGSLYPALSRLEASGAVVGIADTGNRTSSLPSTGSLSGERAALRARRPSGARGTKRARKVYRITDAGLLQFGELLRSDEPSATDDARNFGLRLAFARHLAPQARLSLLERRRARLLDRLSDDRARVAAGEALDTYTRSLVEHGTEVTEHDISWLDRLIESERTKQRITRSDAPSPDHHHLPNAGAATIAAKGPEQ